MSMSSSVWERSHQGYASELSPRAYVAAITGFTFFGLVLASFIAFYTMNWHPGIWEYLFVGLGIPIVGIIIAFNSENWFISLFGYTLVVSGLGAIIGPTVALYETGVVITALMATGGVTLVMSLVGIMYPGSLEHWGSYLFGALLAMLFVRIGQGIMIGLGVSESIWYMPWIEYIGAVLFSMYIIYDWNRALRLQYTLDNAVDSAVAIFLDIANLFLHLLRIIGGRGSSK